MKNFSTRKRFAASVMPTFAVTVAMLSPACDRIDSSYVDPAMTESRSASELSLESVARMLSELPLTTEHVKEVFDGVSSSASNGYDEEYPFANMLSQPGSGVGDELLRTRSAQEYPNPLRSLVSSAHVGSPDTRAGSFLETLADAGLQIYWPYSEDWDGVTMPVMTFNPDDETKFSNQAAHVRPSDGTNIGFLREQLPGGSWVVKEIVVDEDYARCNPVWVVNYNEDSSHMTPQMIEALCPERSAQVLTRSYSDCKTLVLKEFKAHRNYDPWFAGGSEFFVKCGALNGFTATTEDELKLYTPSVTDMMINVKRKQVGKSIRFNTVVVSEWTPQLEECVFLMTEDDGGKQTSWKASGLVKIKSKSYGFEVELPFRRNDDLVWRGKLSSNYFEKYNGKPNRFGDVSVTFSYL